LIFVPNQDAEMRFMPWHISILATKSRYKGSNQILLTILLLILFFGLKETFPTRTRVGNVPN